MLGQPISMLIPRGDRLPLSGELPEGATATDLVLTVTEMLRKKGVVGKFVEFYGPGIASLALADRATIGNMSPGVRRHLRHLPGRRRHARLPALHRPLRGAVALVEAYMKEQGSSTRRRPEPVFTTRSSWTWTRGAEHRRAAPPAGPHPLSQAKKAFREGAAGAGRKPGRASKDASADPEGRRASRRCGARARSRRRGRGLRPRGSRCATRLGGDRRDHELHQHLEPVGDDGRRAAGQEGGGAGLTRQPWVKTSLAPGSKVVTEYYEKSRALLPYLEQLGFHVVGYGCTTCIGNSGPLPEEVRGRDPAGRLVVASVLSGNRNFEGRINSEVRANYLMSPPLVVAYALAGRMDWTSQRADRHRPRRPALVFLKDIWPTQEEVQSIEGVAQRDVPRSYADVFEGDERWKSLPVPEGDASPGRRTPPTCASRRTSTAWSARRGDRWTSAAPAPRGARRQRHHRPHLARRQHQARTRRRAATWWSTASSRGLQLVRLAARQPRGDGARHLRQRAHPQPAGAGHRGRLHHLHLPDDEITTIYDAAMRYQPRGHAAGRAGRQGVRLRLEPRLGGQGAAPAGGQGRDRRELRAHPPLQPGGDGRPAAPVHEGETPSSLGSPAASASTSTGGPRGDRLQPANARGDGARHGRGRRGDGVPRAGADRHAARRCCTTATAASSSTCCGSSCEEGLWVEQQKLLPPNAAPKGWFGLGVALDGDTLAATSFGTRSAHVFVQSGDAWVEQQTLEPDPPSAEAFGPAIALSGDTLIVGASGGAHVFVRDGGLWSLQQKLLPAGAAADANVHRVALEGDRAVVVESSLATVFVRAGARWVEQQTLAGDSPDPGFGASMAIDGDAIAVAMATTPRRGRSPARCTSSCGARISGSRKTR
jgi:hypothetical protein